MYSDATLSKHEGTRGTFFSVLYFTYSSLQIDGESKHPRLYKISFTYNPKKTLLTNSVHNYRINIFLVQLLINLDDGEHKLRHVGCLFLLVINHYFLGFSSKKFLCRISPLTFSRQHWWHNSSSSWCRPWQTSGSCEYNLTILHVAFRIYNCDSCWKWITPMDHMSQHGFLKVLSLS